MHSRSWNALRLDRLKKELKKAGDTVDAFNQLVEFHELEPLEAAELGEQVRWPVVVRVPADAFLPERVFIGHPIAPEQPPPMVIKSFAPPAPAPKMIIKRY